MKFFKYLIFLFFLLFIIVVPAQASVKLSTEKFEFDVKPSENFVTGSFTVFNDDNQLIRFKAYAGYFEISPNGTILTDIKDNNPALTKNIRFNPVEFTLQGNNSQKVRFTIPNIRNLSDGESRVALFLEDAKTKQQALPNSNSRVAANLIIKTRIAVPIYVDKGRIIKTGFIDKFTLDKAKNSYLYSLNVKSTGNSLIRVGGEGQIIQNDELKTEFPINEMPIQGGSVGQFKDILPIEGLSSNEEYKLKVTLSYLGQDKKRKFLNQEIPFKL